MPVIARYDFDESEGPYIHDSSPVDGVQLGWYVNGAVPQDGRLVLDGDTAFGKLFLDPTFQMDRGTLDFQFSPASLRDTPQTLVSRDSIGNTPGGFRIELMPDGSIRSTHETGEETFIVESPAGFVSPGDEVFVTYSWDQGGSGGRAVFTNLTTGEEVFADVPATLGMDMGDLNQNWLFGAGQQNVQPGELAGIDQYFHGNFSHVQFSDTVDNCAVVPCFTAGTLIATPEGLRPVEALRAGDRVITRDHGVQQLIWVGQRQLEAVDLRMNPRLRPVRIRAGAFGPGRPAEDLLVSPNHRMLVSTADNQLHFDDPEVLVAARLLVNGSSILIDDAATVTYVHILFERHELVLTAECWTESFQPAVPMLDRMGEAQRDEILALFPALRRQERETSFPGSRRSLTRKEAALLMDIAG